MGSAMRIIAEGSSELGSACHYDIAACGRSLDRFVYKVENARQIIAVARANEPSCLAEVGAVTSAFSDRYYYDLLSIRASLHTGDVAESIANVRKATADVSDTANVKAAAKRALIACEASSATDKPAADQLAAAASDLPADKVAAIQQECARLWGHDPERRVYCQNRRYEALGLSTKAKSQPQTTPEKVRAAVAAQYSCTPLLRNIKFSASDNTGAIYFAGCGRWIYLVSIDPQGQIDKVSRTFEWNGVN
jgi:hypothetical protein